MYIGKKKFVYFSEGDFMFYFLQSTKLEAATTKRTQ